MAKWTIAAFFVLYFAVLTTGIAPPTLADFPRLRLARDIFQSLTGAGGSFGFFSPNIGNQVLVEFEVDGRSRIRLHELVSGEVALRVSNMYRLFVETYAKKELKRSIAASLAAEVFRREPLAAKVTMIVSVYRFPSLAQYGNGVRPQTTEVYRITFIRSGVATESS